METKKNACEDRLRLLYPAVDESETPLPRAWSTKDKFTFIGLSQNNLRVHYKGKSHIVWLALAPTFVVPRHIAEQKWRFRTFSETHGFLSGSILLAVRRVMTTIRRQTQQRMLGHRFDGFRRREVRYKTCIAPMQRGTVRIFAAEVLQKRLRVKSTDCA